MGLELLREGKYQESIYYFDVAFEVDPTMFNVLNNKGLALAYLGRSQDAIDCFQKLIQLNPNDDNIWNNLGNIFQDLDRFKEAIDCYNKAISINPNNPDALNNIEFAYSEMRKSENEKNKGKQQQFPSNTNRINEFSPEIISLLQRYEIDISKQVTFDIVKKKRKYWVELLHPDKNTNKSEETRKMAEHKLKEMNDIYRQLKEYFKNTYT